MPLLLLVWLGVGAAADRLDRDVREYAWWRLPLPPAPADARFVSLEVRFPVGTLTTASLVDRPPAGGAWRVVTSDLTLTDEWRKLVLPIRAPFGPRLYDVRATGDRLVLPPEQTLDRLLPRSHSLPRLRGGEPDPRRLGFVELEFQGVVGLNGPRAPVPHRVRRIAWLTRSPVESRLAAGPVTIAVDASGDLGPINPIWRDACETSRAFTPLGQRLYKVFGAAAFGTRYPPATGGGVYRWREVDEQIRLATAAAPLIQIVLGRDVPAWLQSPGETGFAEDPPTLPWTPGHLRPPRDLAAYEAQVHALARHIRDELGCRVHSYLIWGGADSRAFFRGTVDEYLDVYAACARAIRRADPEARVGGPSPDPHFGAAWLRAFVAGCAARRLPLDFVSLHSYSLYPDQAAEAVRWTRELLAGYADYRDAPIHVDEWNSQLGLGAYLADFKRSAQNAAYAAAMFGALTDAGVAFAPYASPAESWRLFGSPLDEPDGTPRPILGTFRLFARLTGRRVPVTVDPPDAGVGALAAVDGGRVRVCVWAYDPDGDPAGAARAVAVRLTGLTGQAQIDAVPERPGELTRLSPRPPADEGMVIPIRLPGVVSLELPGPA